MRVRWRGWVWIGGGVVLVLLLILLVIRRPRQPVRFHGHDWAQYGERG